MGVWLVDAETMARGRFAYSPLAETCAALLTLAEGTPGHPGEARWLASVLPRFRARLGADPVDRLLLGRLAGASWVADFWIPSHLADGERTFREELAEVAAVAPEQVREDLRPCHPGVPLPAELLADPDPAGRTAALLEWVWREAVEPDWERRRRLLETDVLFRTVRLGRGGWSAALEGLRPGTRWLGAGRLQINRYDLPPRVVSGADLVFVPVTPRRGWVSWERTGGSPGPAGPAGPAGYEVRPGRFGVVYPAHGVAAVERQPGGAGADGGGAAADGGGDALPRGSGGRAGGTLARLLGAGRAEVLALLAPEAPVSTTQLVALTGLPLGAVGRHLRILREAGLADRRRIGRSVLYARTPAGDVVVRAAGSGRPPPQ
ncbi:DUF5937 family protein [Phaeacidiphilus oryzae]|uniref:DUF5937 family protein n=1 Tax=Phaeacidiphilus oryzae TaxID=348818 RepID=UPI000562F3BE|nr:DUF5937 family protein [Phaeacidiphilus oryzae]